MPKSIPALVEPKMLRWTRENAGYDMSAAAQRLGVGETKIREWESGTGHPTMAQLRNLGEFYKFPIAIFYLVDPPEDATKIKDFRRLPKGQRAAFSPKLRYLIRQTRYRQEWLREYREANDYSEIEFVGSQTARVSPGTLGKSIRAILGMSIDEQKSWLNAEYALSGWIRRVERIGICVFQSSGIEVEEMRGFALPDSIAPVVMINGKDSRAARIFTLLHEVAHIALGRAGISNMVPGDNGEDQKIELLCNAAAAEALVPTDDFTVRISEPEDVTTNAAIRELSVYYRVSEEVIVRKMFDLDLVTRKFYEAKRSEYAKRRPQKRNRPTLIPRGQIIARNNGREFSKTAASAFHAGEISGGELSDLLGMKLDHLRQLEAEL